MAGTLGATALINTNATTTIKTGTGVLHRIIVGDIGSDWTIAVYDDTAGTANQFASITPTQTGAIDFGTKFTNGLTIVTSGTTAGTITVVWE